jgi:hypothetical protein
VTQIVDLGVNIKKDKHKLVFFIDFCPMQATMNKTARKGHLGDFV